jgi:hypothetical protein
VADQISAAESAVTNDKVKAALRDAHSNLMGNAKGNPKNGAVQELGNGDLVAALVKIGAAIKVPKVSRR